MYFGADNSQDTEERPSVPRFAGWSGRLTISRAWQKVAPYPSRRPPARSPSRGRGKQSLLIRRDATPRPSSLQLTCGTFFKVRRKTAFFSYPQGSGRSDLFYWFRSVIQVHTFGMKNA